MTTHAIPDEQAALAALLRQRTMSTAGNDAANCSQQISIETLGQYTCFCKLRGFCADKNADSCLRQRNLYQEFVNAAR